MRTSSPRPEVARRAGAGSYAGIHAVIRRIPRGRVATYGQIAELAGLGGQPRRVGYALHALPPRSAVPWHRVLNAQGRLSIAALDPDAAWQQRLLLESEGVEFDARGRVPLARYQWRSVSRRGRKA